MRHAWFALSCALALFACNSSGEMRESTREPNDATDAPRDAATRDAARSDASSDSDESNDEDDVDAGSPGSSDAQVARDARTDAAASDPSDAGTGALDPSTVDTFVYVGGWANDYPFRTYQLDRTSYALTPVGDSVNVGNNPSFITPSADGKRLYIANENWSGPTGVTTATIDATTGRATKLDQITVQDAGAFVFTSLSPDGKFLLAADYNAGQLVVFRIDGDGKVVKQSVDTEKFAKPSDGSQESAQTHSVRMHPNGKWVYAPNKAIDKIACFTLNGATGALTALDTVEQPGGPRHIAFDPAGKYAFVVTELSNELVVYRVGNDGKLSKVDSKSTLPSGFAGSGNTGAHVLVHPNGKVVYASNRGQAGEKAAFANSIVAFTIGGDGKLTLLQHTDSRGLIPRNFDIDSTGTLLVVANQGNQNASDGTLAAFAIAADGKLTPKGTPVSGLVQSNAVAIVTRPKR